MEFRNILPGYRHYDKDWLMSEFEAGAAIKYICFWGHTPGKDEVIGKECFSQWYPASFSVNGIEYKTAEHWMMAQKALLFDNPEIYRRIIATNKPGEVKELGRQITGFDELIWNEEKYGIVRLGNIHKFNQHPALKAFLLSSPDRVLVEASPVDKIWGIGISKDDGHIADPNAWPGQNLLGFALMEVRDFFLEFGELNESNVVLCPWIKYPGINPLNMFWKNGEGEEYIVQHATQLKKLNRKAQVEYYLNNPAPYQWRDYYFDL